MIGKVEFVFEDGTQIRTYQHLNINPMNTSVEEATPHQSALSDRSDLHMYQCVCLLSVRFAIGLIRDVAVRKHWDMIA